MKSLALIITLTLAGCADNITLESPTPPYRAVETQECSANREQIYSNIEACCASPHPREDAYQTIWCESDLVKRYDELLVSQSCEVRTCFAGATSNPCQALIDECSWSQADHNAYLRDK